MSRRRIIIIVNIVAVVIVVALAFLIWPRFRQGDQEQMPTPTSTPVILSNREVAKGILVPVQFANLSFTTGGIVEEILVEEGDDVETDSPLVALNAEQQKSALAQAQADLAAAESDLQVAEAGLETALADVDDAELEVSSAEARLALVKAGASPEEIAAAEEKVAAAQSGVGQASAERDASLEIPESEVRAAEANVAAARAEVERLQESYDQIINTCFTGPDGNTVCPLYGTVEENTRAQLEAAQLNLKAAQAALDALNAGASAGQRQAAAGRVTIALANRDLAEAQLNVLSAKPTAEELGRAEMEVAQARARVERAEAAVERARATVSQAEVGIELARGKVEVAQNALDTMTLRALFPGTVGEIEVKIGQQVTAGSPILVLADLDEWLVETTDLGEQNIARVEIGAPAEVTIDAISGETLAGTISDISRVFQSEAGEVIYQVTVDLEERPDLPLRWGMSAEVDYAPGS